MGIGILRAACCLAMVVAMLPGALRAQCNPEWKLGDAPTGVNIYIWSSMPWDPDGAGPQPEQLVAGGYFGDITGIPARNIAMFDGSTWHPMGPGLTTAYNGGDVTSLTVFEGELVAAGGFTMSGSQSVRGVARWDGQAWHQIGPGTGVGGVNALAVFNGELIAGGDRSLGGTNSPVVRWTDGFWQPVAQGLNGHVFCLQVHEGSLYAGGSFQQISGSLPVSYVARWNGSQWTSVGNGNALNFWPRALSEFEGDLIAAGTDGNVARWDGQLWTMLPRIVGMATATAIATFEGQLIVGGVNQHIVRWDGTAWRPLEPQLHRVDTLATFQNKLFVTGWFNRTALAPTDKNIAWWDGDHWAPASPGLNGSIGSLALFRGEVFAIGGFTGTGPGALRSCAKWNGTNWQSPGADLTGATGSMTVFEDQLIVSRNTPGFGQPLGHVVRWDGQSWQNLGEPIPSVAPNVVAVVQGSLLAAGNGIVRWTGSSWQPVGGAIYGVSQLVELNGELIASGSFTNANGVPAVKIARWDGATWHALGTGIPNGVRALAVHQGELLAATSSYQSPYVLHWNGSSWVPMDSGLTFAVSTFLVANGTLLAGTSGTGIGDTGAIARWDGAQWRALDTPIAGTASSLIQDGDKIAAAGSFTINSRVSYFARLACPCYANCDNSTTAPILTPADFACFIDQFAAGAGYGNCDGSSGQPFLTGNDFQCFLDRFVAGCP